ncbi:hypothetical protein HZS_7377 [Henneguya salminicola]|nr:hypothetical protein HZS_7377 [Henneguya salminicola]
MHHTNCPYKNTSIFLGECKNDIAFLVGVGRSTGIPVSKKSRKVKIISWEATMFPMDIICIDYAGPII